MWLRGKAVVVTGAGAGIGAAVAHLAGQLGASVVVNDIDEAAADAVSSRIRNQGGQAVAHAGDVSRRADSAALVRRCVTEFHRIDGLVNNAALMAVGRLEDHDDEHLRRLLDVNVVGVVNCAAEAIGHMYRQGRGSIVNVTSGAHLGLADMSAYAATKGAVASLTYCWATEAAATAVRINAVSPLAASGMTELTDRYRVGIGLPEVTSLAPRPEANAPLVCYLLSDRAAGVSGQVVRMDGDRLSLMAHPAILAPVLVRPSWTVTDVDAAFSAVLAHRQAPTGLAWVDATAVTAAPDPVQF